jgi:anaerobic dimethyl sulfoxide reductase subunit B (iron-sulfur subunit)
MQLGFYFDQTRCTGCHTCNVACKDWHDIEAGPVNWMRVTTIEQGRFPHVFVAWLVLPCCHCEQPDCVAACPVGAITKRADDGIVVVDRELCLGKNKCDLCLQACPYQVPQFGTENNAKMQKCDLCLERVTEGQQPICVEACPMWALDFGSLDQLKARYGEVTEAVGFAYDPGTRPAIIFKAKKIPSLPVSG